MDKLEDERERVMLRWMVAAQRENLVDEWAFDWYNVDDKQREKWGGRRYTLVGVPETIAFVSLLNEDTDSPLRRVAFHKDGLWIYRTEEHFPDVVLLWMYNDQTGVKSNAVTKVYGILGDRGTIRVGVSDGE
jgi:hypothetical protein